MKRRLKKKVEKRERQRLHQMLDIALNINGVEERTFEKTGNRPTAFFEFSGHIGVAKVTVCEAGWLGGRRPDIEAQYSTAKWLKSTYPYQSAEMDKLLSYERQVRRHEI